MSTEAAFEIRDERASDADSIRAVHRSAFPTDYEGRLVDGLRTADKLTMSLVAEVGDEIVGHVAFSPVSLEGTSGGLGLAPVAVLETHRRHGIAAALIRTGLEICKRDGAPFVVVLGDPAYYSRFGFGPAGKHALHDDYGGGDAFQVQELEEGALPDSGGRVRYAPEFDDLA